MSVLMELTIVGSTEPRSNTYLIEAASAMNTIVGSAPPKPRRKLLSTKRKSPQATVPATRPKIRKYAIRITTV